MKNREIDIKKNAIKRILNLKKVEDTIDLSDSYLEIDGRISKELFESEINKITFSTHKKCEIKSIDIYLTSNELIDDEVAEELKEQLGIEILGDGSFFEILDYKTDFMIQFDQENTEFIASEDIKNGCVVFKK